MSARWSGCPATAAADRRSATTPPAISLPRGSLCNNSPEDQAVGELPGAAIIARPPADFGKSAEIIQTACGLVLGCNFKHNRAAAAAFRFVEYRIEQAPPGALPAQRRQHAERQDLDLVRRDRGRG